MARAHKKRADARAALLFALAVLVLVGAVALLALKLFSPGGDTVVAPTATPTAVPTDSPEPTFRQLCDGAPTPPPEPAATPRAATIRAVGDVMMHKHQLNAALRPDGSYDFRPQYAEIGDSIRAADYAIANLETTVGLYSDKPYSGFPMFNAPEELLAAVKEAGFDFLTLANNHMLDRFYDGMVQTVDRVEEYGFDFGGANRSQQEKDAPNIVNVNGISLGMLCYTQSTNKMEKRSDPRAKQFGINYLGDADFAADVKALREAGAEMILAMVHWGSEYRGNASSYQVRMAKKLAAAGVDIILGSHPHVVQPAGFVRGVDRDGREREVLVAYSLGNFNSYMDAEGTDCGIILEFTLREKPEGGFAIEDAGYVPTYCWRQDGVAQTISAALYNEVPPEGMADECVEAMRSGYRDIVGMMGDDLILLRR